MYESNDAQLCSDFRGSLPRAGRSKKPTPATVAVPWSRWLWCQSGCQSRARVGPAATGSERLNSCLRAPGRAQGRFLSSLTYPRNAPLRRGVSISAFAGDSPLARATLKCPRYRRARVGARSATYAASSPVSTAPPQAPPSRLPAERVELTAASTRKGPRAVVMPGLSQLGLGRCDRLAIRAGRPSGQRPLASRRLCPYPASSPCPRGIRTRNASPSAWRRRAR
jgi:hypothetical protein